LPHRQARGVGGQAGQFLLGQRLLEFLLDGIQLTDACQRSATWPAALSRAS
jgi:hypothetical protein